MRWFMPMILALAVAGCSSTALKRLEPDNLFANTTPNAFLRSTQYDAMTFEAVPVLGAEPPMWCMDYLVARARQYCSKPNGITYVISPSVPVAAQSWTTDDLRKFRDKNAKLKTNGKTLVVHLLFVKGNGDEDGYSAEQFDPTMAAFYYEKIGGDNLMGILVHEFGHMLGLVGNGTPAVSNHKHHDAHCDNVKCAMYWTSPSGYPDYDEHCQADLQAGR